MPLRCGRLPAWFESCLGNLNQLIMEGKFLVTIKDTKERQHFCVVKEPLYLKAADSGSYLMVYPNEDGVRALSLNAPYRFVDQPIQQEENFTKADVWSALNKKPGITWSVCDEDEFFTQIEQAKEHMENLLNPSFFKKTK